MINPSLTLVSHFYSSHKRPSFLLLIILFIVSTTAFAQSSSSPDLIPYRKGNRWGYKNLDGKIIIRAKYMAVDFFREDTALVYVRKKLPKAERPKKKKVPIFKWIPYSQFDNDYNYIHLHFRDTIIGSVRYDRFKYVPESYYINKQGKVIGKAPLIKNSDILLCNLKKYHNTCQLYVRTGYNQIQMMPERERTSNRPPLRLKNVYCQKIIGANPLMGDSEYKYGLLGSNGDTLTPAKFMAIYLLTFQADTFYRLGNSIFNSEGKKVIKKFEEIRITKQGYFLALKNGRFYYYNKQGKLLIPAFDDYMLLSNNMINVTKWPIFSFHHVLNGWINLRDLQSAIYTIDGRKMCKYAGGYKYHIKGNLYGIESTRDGVNDEDCTNFLLIGK